MEQVAARAQISIGENFCAQHPDREVKFICLQRELKFYCKRCSCEQQGKLPENLDSQFRDRLYSSTPGLQGFEQSLNKLVEDLKRTMNEKQSSMIHLKQEILEKKLCVPATIQKIKNRILSQDSELFEQLQNSICTFLGEVYKNSFRNVRINYQNQNGFADLSRIFKNSNSYSFIMLHRLFQPIGIEIKEMEDYQKDLNGRIVTLERKKEEIRQALLEQTNKQIVRIEQLLSDEINTLTTWRNIYEKNHSKMQGLSRDELQNLIEIAEEHYKFEKYVYSQVPETKIFQQIENEFNFHEQRRNEGREDNQSYQEINCLLKEITNLIKRGTIDMRELQIPFVLQAQNGSQIQNGEIFRYLNSQGCVISPPINSDNKITQEIQQDGRWEKKYEGKWRNRQRSDESGVEYLIRFDEAGIDQSAALDETITFLFAEDTRNWVLQFKGNFSEDLRRDGTYLYQNNSLSFRSNVVNGREILEVETFQPKQNFLIQRVWLQRAINQELNGGEFTKLLNKHLLSWEPSCILEERNLIIILKQENNKSSLTIFPKGINREEQQNRSKGCQLYIAQAQEFRNQILQGNVDWAQVIRSSLVTAVGYFNSQLQLEGNGIHMVFKWAKNLQQQRPEVPDELEKCEGNHQNGKLQGVKNKTTIYSRKMIKDIVNPQGFSDYLNVQEIYKGEFKDGKYFGQGTQTRYFANGGSVRHKGRFEAGKKEKKFESTLQLTPQSQEQKASLVFKNDRIQHGEFCSIF